MGLIFRAMFDQRMHISVEFTPPWIIGPLLFILIETAKPLFYIELLANLDDQSNYSTPLYKCNKVVFSHLDIICAVF